MPGFWSRLLGRRRAASVRRETEEEHMSPEERSFVDQRFDDYQADQFVEEHLGGIDPKRLLDDDKPPRP
jgi:hypothetical protein